MRPLYEKLIGCCDAYTINHTHTHVTVEKQNKVSECKLTFSQTKKVQTKQVRSYLNQHDPHDVRKKRKKSGGYPSRGGCPLRYWRLKSFNRTVVLLQRAFLLLLKIENPFHVYKNFLLIYFSFNPTNLSHENLIRPLMFFNLCLGSIFVRSKKGIAVPLMYRSFRQYQSETLKRWDIMGKHFSCFAINFRN